jgi:transcriptional regulator with XRE-family HTH domain
MIHRGGAKWSSPKSDTELGRRLSSMRLRAGLTQTEVAGKVAVSRQHISNIENGITSPTLRVLQDYLHACGTDLAQFFYGPLPIDQTSRQREYHGKLQTLLENQTTSAVVTKVLDSFMTSMQPSPEPAAEPVGVQARRTRAQYKEARGRYKRNKTET